MSFLSKIRRPQLTLRFKILGLITGALSASLLSYISVGTSLISQDKVSYIYDYNLTRVKAAAQKVDDQIMGAVTFARAEGVAVDHVEAENAAMPVAEAAAGIQGMLFMRAGADGKFEVARGVGKSADILRARIASLGWTPETFQKNEILLSRAETTGVYIGGSTANSHGAPVQFVMHLDLKSGAAEAGKDFQLFVLDTSGQLVGTRDPISTENVGFAQETSKSVGSLLAGFDSGVRNVTLKGEEYISGYQKIAQGKLVVVGLVPKAIAFTATEALAKRSVALGLSILLIALGATLLLVRKMTTRLKQIHFATKKVSEGDFTFRVEAGMTSDEVNDLAQSFNVMAGKIDDLMIQTAQKARMELELATAQVVQSRFFPVKDFESPNLRLAGKFLPASECSGDWWQYVKIGDHLVVAVGDVTGHGASAALVTAAAHASFSRWTKVLLRNKLPPDIQSLASELNDAVLAASGGQSTMTLAASIVDLTTGRMTYTSASHPPQYLFRTQPAEEGEAPESQEIQASGLSKSSGTIPLVGARSTALGDQPELQVEVATLQLRPGDYIFWYTDGVFEMRQDKKKISKVSFVNMLSKMASEHEENAHNICDSLMSDVTKFFGDDATERPDDITLVVASIPKSAASMGIRPKKAA
jgi:serine phosphatase RsbU (regulator of sigma subunit)